jgi:peptidyl-prolyl cis-trans isomerase C
MLPQIGKTGFAAMAVVAMAMMAVPTLAHAKADDSTLAATVNGDKITKGQVENVMKSNNVKDEDAAKAYPVIVDEIINEKLIDAAAAKADVQKTPEFQQRLEASKAQLVKQMYLESYLKNKVDDKAVKAEYEKFKKDNKGKEEVHARHILLKTEDEAKQVIKDLNDGAKFEDLAKERSTDPSAKNGGDIGYFAKDELIPAFSDAAFKLKPGTYTKEPVKSQFGYHVIYVIDKRERVVPDLKTVEAAIRNKLGQDAVKQLLTNLTAKADIKRFDIDGKPVTTKD